MNKNNDYIDWADAEFICSKCQYRMITTMSADIKKDKCLRYSGKAAVMLEQAVPLCDKHPVYKPPLKTDGEWAQEIKNNCTGDAESDHDYVDGVLCEILEELGYSKTIAAYNEVEKEKR